MHLHAAACVFESWAPHPDYPEQVGNVKCCGRSVIMTNGRIECPVCDTVVERQPDGWKILRAKGKPFSA